ncbi:imidazolonepropionase [Caulobacter sp. SLTY]|uniref:imidazolonepropionase n=1 Tax=Caulobacter sp. SLTY TaxID=2683262 RepID=UPI0014134777|nr:imidazolonepropionase [Caulobacter sp. SLTY]NBB17491.1 imidazolonepropionase [Caulobacter sp. SLTY]
MHFDRLWLGGRLATLSPAREGLGLIEDGAVGAVDGRIAFAGPASELPAGWTAGETIALDGRLVTPGLIDCHTHLVFAGDRADEFEMRLRGETYETIAAAGGGIVSTVAKTRAASEAELVEGALDRLDRLMAEGVTAIEVKSGYGLDLESELKMLRAARALETRRPVSVATSLLAAHTLPPEHRDSRDAYVAKVVEEIIPAAVGLADAVDAFCETNAFTPAEVRRVFEAARAHGLPVRLHADQRTAGGGASLAAEYGALSADHLERTDVAGARALAAAGTVAVLLPGAYYALRDEEKPPVALFRAAGVRMAVATDCNPGSSPLTSILTALNMAVILFGLTGDEALAGVTREAARAIGRADEMGTLEVGKACNLAIWDATRPVELAYWLGRNPLHSRVYLGELT